MRLGGIPAKLFLGNAILLIIALTGASVWILGSAQRHINERTAARLFDTAQALHDELIAGDGPAPARFDELARRYAGADTQVEARLLDGTRLALPRPGRARPAGETLLDAPEVERAWRQTRAFGVRALRPGEPAQVVAAVALPPGSPVRMLCLARDEWSLAAAPGFLPGLAGCILLLALLVTLALGLGVRALWSRPMQRLTVMADSLAEGNLRARIELAGADELAALARSLNELCARWAGDMQTIDRQRAALAALLDQLHEGVIVARPDGRISLINPAAVALLNLDADRGPAMVGQLVERCVPQHELQKMLQIDHATEGNGRTSGISAPLQIANLQLEGGEGAVHLLARASDLELPDVNRATSGSMVGRLLVLTDITELTRTIQIKADFVANASHELRTPLSTIRAAVETLQAMDLHAELDEAKRFIHVIDRHTGRLSAMVSDLLDLARLESPPSKFERVELDPLDILEEVQERFADVVKAKGLSWECRHEIQRGATILANPHLLRLVLDNLVDNAVKFTERGGGVRLTCRRETGQVTFEVSDDGCGIPEPEQERVFERFYQVERARSGAERGTGLGLSIVRHATAALDGSVSLSSKPGAGTRVTVRIPQPE